MWVGAYHPTVCASLISAHLKEDFHLMRFLWSPDRLSFSTTHCFRGSTGLWSSGTTFWGSPHAAVEGGEQSNQSACVHVVPRTQAWILEQCLEALFKWMWVNELKQNFRREAPFPSLKMTSGVHFSRWSQLVTGIGCWGVWSWPFFSHPIHSCHSRSNRVTTVECDRSLWWG